MNLETPANWRDLLTDLNTVIGPLSGLFTIFSGLVVVYLTFVILRFTAKPRLRVSLYPERQDLIAGQTVHLRMRIENRGYWYARPAATNLWVFVNFPAAFLPRQIRYGSDRKLSSDAVRVGKGNTRYVIATGINLFHEEPGEHIEIDVRLPDRAGKYVCRVAIHTDRGDDCGVHPLRLYVAPSS